MYEKYEQLLSTDIRQVCATVLNFESVCGGNKVMKTSAGLKFFCAESTVSTFM